MYAVVETGGKQYKVSTGDTIKVEKLDAQDGAEITLSTVVALVGDDAPRFGNPFVEGASVSAEVIDSGKGKKVIVFKQKPRKGYRKRRGHRQEFTTLRIKDIKGGSDGS